MIDNYWAVLAITAGVPPPHLLGQYSGENEGWESKIWGSKEGGLAQGKVSRHSTTCSNVARHAKIWALDLSGAGFTVSRSVFQHFISSC